LKTGKIFKLARRITRIISVGFVLRPVDFVAEDISNNKFFNESRLEQILVSMFCRNLLCLSYVVYDLSDIIH